MLKYVAQSAEVKLFREDIVRHIAKREMADHAFTRWLCQLDNNCEDYYMTRPPCAYKQLDDSEEAVKKDWVYFN